MRRLQLFDAGADSERRYFGFIIVRLDSLALEDRCLFGIEITNNWLIIDLLFIHFKL